MPKQNTWEAFFDLEAPLYEQNGFTQNTLAEVDFLLEELGLQPGAAVLDVGCGTGRHAIELARRGYAVTGVDLSTGMLAQAKAKALAAGVTVNWIQCDATRFSSDQQFDAAICLCEGAFGLLGSQADAIEQPLAILSNISRALKPQGKCLFTVLNGLKMIRQQSQDDVEQQRFDPLTLSSVSEQAPAGGHSSIQIRERAFVPTELSLLFRLAGITVLQMWGGTAGEWKREPINLDEMEIMVVAEKKAG
ncbi:MAG: methyltransferase domain-containing protein [Caldilineaceae bacterium]